MSEDCDKEVCDCGNDGCGCVIIKEHNCEDCEKEDCDKREE